MIYTEFKPNPHIARIWDDYEYDIPYDDIDEKIYGDLSRPSMYNPVRNTKFAFLKFNNSYLFSPAAKYFNENGNYTRALPGTKDYRKYWFEERNRCLIGYEPLIDGSPCGIRISGEHYFYLNYSRIGLVVLDETTGEATERLGFPKFSSMDYYWYKVLGECENPKNVLDKRHMIAVKARRKGFSFKNAAGAVWKYSFFKESKVVIASEFGSKAKQTFDMALDMIDFLNEHTEFRSPWTHRKSSTTKCLIRAGIEVEVNGRKFVKGRKSSIQTISLHNKPDAAAGLGATRLILEESGQIKYLKEAWAFTEPTLRSGAYLKGICICFGTGGENDGAARDFSDMFYDPELYGFKSFDNIYEEADSSSRCGWFVDDMWFREGAKITLGNTTYEAFDESGNAHKWVAELHLNLSRDQAKGGGSYDTFITQYCKTPSEAFMSTTSAIFDTAEIFSRLQRLKLKKNKKFLGTPGNLVMSNKSVIFTPSQDAKPLDHYPLKSIMKNREGCVVLYESPHYIGEEVPRGAYLISIDPITIDSETGESLIAIYCMKTKKYAHIIGHDEIVMSYIGRSKYDPINTANEILVKMSMFYNAYVTHENDVNASSVRNFFIEKKEFQRLLSPPSSIVDKYIQNSKTNARKTGHSLSSDKMKQIAEQYTKKWLMEKRHLNSETGEVERNIDVICDIALLQELMAYNRKDNFDRVSSLFGLVLQGEQLMYQNTLEEEFKNEKLPSNFFVQNFYKITSRQSRR
tara:strand:+ start:6046 stop:8277 length:2232 start_codon:yes stop_codon:yes gene_type:complete